MSCFRSLVFSSGQRLTGPAFVLGRRRSSARELATGTRARVPDDLQDSRLLIFRHLVRPSSAGPPILPTVTTICQSLCWSKRLAASSFDARPRPPDVPTCPPSFPPATTASPPSSKAPARRSLSRSLSRSLNRSPNCLAKRSPNRSPNCLPGGLPSCSPRPLQRPLQRRLLPSSLLPNSDAWSTRQPTDPLGSITLLTETSQPLNPSSPARYLPHGTCHSRTSSRPVARDDCRVAHETISSVCQSHLAVVDLTPGGVPGLGHKMDAKGSHNVYVISATRFTAPGRADSERFRKLSPVNGAMPMADSSRNAEACFRREV